MYPVSLPPRNPTVRSRASHALHRKRADPCVTSFSDFVIFPLFRTRLPFTAATVLRYAVATVLRCLHLRPAQAKAGAGAFHSQCFNRLGSSQLGSLSEGAWLGLVCLEGRLIPARLQLAQALGATATLCGPVWFFPKKNEEGNRLWSWSTLIRAKNQTRLNL